MTNTSENLQKKIRQLSRSTYKAVTIIDKCESCGTCIMYCPLKIRVFNVEGRAVTINTDHSCGGCSVCFHRCPHHAVKLVGFSRKRTS